MASALGLLLLCPLFLLLALVVKLDSRGPVFYRQERIGRHFVPFRIYKFRTMVMEADRGGPAVTVGGDPRVTRAGRFLRKWKLDELPQLINVLLGDMSLVGPRPEVRRYAELFEEDYRELLGVRPGITDPASIHYSSEEEVLSAAPDWERAYVEEVLPEKIRLSKQYLDRPGLPADLRLICATLGRLIGSGGGRGRG